MPGRPPQGEPAPADGALPASALAGLGNRPFGVYVHVPFCASRCGYCDFTTFTATELAGGTSRRPDHGYGTASQASYADDAIAEVRLARRVLGSTDLPVSTVFFGAGTDHISAYALVVEDGTRLAAQVRRGEIAAPDDDVLADRYVAADETLSGAGFSWYEVSNWASSPAARCRHNEGYWRGGDWWGGGPRGRSTTSGGGWGGGGQRTPAAEAARGGPGPAAGRGQL